MPGGLSFEEERQEKERAREESHRAANVIREGKAKVKSVLSRSLTTVGSLFEVMDLDGNGSLDSQEFASAVLALGVQVSREVTDLVFADFDFSGDGQINHHEFVRFMLRDALSNSSTRVMDLFHKWDEDGSGELDFNEFKRAIDELGWIVPHHELENVFNEIDEDDSGTVSFAELHRQLRQGSTIQLAKKLKPGQAGVIEVKKVNKRYALRGSLAAQSVAARRPATSIIGAPHPRANAQLAQSSAELRVMTAPAQRLRPAPNLDLLQGQWMQSLASSVEPAVMPSLHPALGVAVGGAKPLAQSSTLRSYLLAPSTFTHSNTSSIRIPAAQRYNYGVPLASSAATSMTTSQSAPSHLTSSSTPTPHFVVHDRRRRQKTQDERAHVATDLRPHAEPVVYRSKLLRGTSVRWVEPLPSINPDRSPVWKLTAFAR